MASVVPLPLLKPNCIPSKHTLDLTFFFNNSFKYLHCMIQHFYPSVGTALQRVALALVYCDHPALLPVIGDFTLIYIYI